MKRIFKIFLIDLSIFVFVIYLFPGFTRKIVDFVSGADFFTKTVTVELVVIAAIYFLLLRKEKIYRDIENRGNDAINDRFRFFIILASEVFLSIFVFFVASYFIMVLFGKLSFDLENKGDFLTLLEVMLGFLGVIGAGIYYFISKQIEKDVEGQIRKKQGEIEECFEIEREMSKAEMHLNSGYNHMRFCEFYLKNREENGNRSNPYRNTGNYEDNPAYLEILKAVDRAEKGKEYLDRIRELDEGEEKVEYKRKYYIAHNNVAYYLERKWNYIFMFEGVKGSRSRITSYLSGNTCRKKYNSDRRKVSESINFLHEEGSVRRFPDLSQSFQDTESKIEKTFLA